MKTLMVWLLGFPLGIAIALLMYAALYPFQVIGFALEVVAHVSNQLEEMQNE